MHKMLKINSKELKGGYFVNPLSFRCKKFRLNLFEFSKMFMKIFFISDVKKYLKKITPLIVCVLYFYHLLQFLMYVAYLRALVNLIKKYIKLNLLPIVAYLKAANATKL